MGMNKLLATTAIALLFMSGNAMAFGDTNAKAEAEANNSNKIEVENKLGQDQKQNQLQLQDQNQKQKQDQAQQQAAIAAQHQEQQNDNRDNFEFNQNQEFKASAIAPSGAISMGGSGAASTKCFTVGRKQGWGLFGSGAVPGTSGGGLVSRDTTEESADVLCWLGEARADMVQTQQWAEVEFLDCMNPFKRRAKEAVKPGSCNGAPVVTQVIIRTEDTTLDQAIANVAPVVAKAPVVTPAPQPVAAAVPPSKPDFTSCKGAADETACLNRKSRG